MLIFSKIRLGVLVRDTFEKTIWAPGAIPVEEWKYRNLKRVWFPLSSAVFLLAGISALYSGVPAISKFFEPEFVVMFAVLLVLAASFSFFGQIFPNLWPVEVLGDTLILGLMAGYVTSRLLLENQNPPREFPLAITLAAIIPIVWKLTLLASEWQTRRNNANLNSRSNNTEGG